MHALLCTLHGLVLCEGFRCFIDRQVISSAVDGAAFARANKPSVKRVDCGAINTLPIS